MPASLPIKPKNSQTWTNKLYVRQVKEEPDAACSKLTPLFSCYRYANDYREEAKRNRGGRVHAIIAKRERQSTLILIYVSQTSTEMEQSGIEVGVRAIRKWWESACREKRPFVISVGSQSPS